MKILLCSIILSLFLNTANGQLGWVPQTSGTSSSLLSVYFTDNNTGWAVGNAGTILKTTNSGANWTPQTSGTGNPLQSVYFIDTNTGWAVGKFGTSLKTIDGGTNWTMQTIGTGNWLHSVCFVDSYSGWTVAGYGAILKTTNGGSSWIFQPSGTSQYLFSVHFTDINTGWAVGQDGTVLRSTDGGTSWTPQTSGTSNLLYSVHFTDMNIGWAVGYYGTILSTTNTGLNWALQTSGTSNHLRSVYFTDDNTGWVVGEGGKILKTTNAGITWTPQTSGTDIWLNSVHFTDNNTGWAVGAYGTILKTVTGGQLTLENCLISGADSIYYSYSPVRYVSDRTQGSWALLNEGGANASIISGMDNDTAFINPGFYGGRFILIYSSDSVSCSKTVRVIAPALLNCEHRIESVDLINPAHFGYTVNSAGDFNADGYDDLMIGAPGYGNGWTAIYFGSVSTPIIPDMIINGEIPNFGFSCSGAGDVNSDGYDDVIIGSTGNSGIAGRAYLYFGNQQGLINGIVLNGETAGDRFGYSVCKAGDMNLDGFDDVIVGSRAGKAYIYFGGLQMDNIADVILNDPSPGSDFGKSVSYAGDVNGDGFSDVVVGAYRYLNNTGRAYVYLGGAQMNDVPDVIMTGEAVGFDLKFGSYVGSAGDVDNDGFSDVVIGRGDEIHPFNGATLFRGGTNMDNIPDLGFAPQVYGEDERFSQVFLNDDFNGDGFSDVMVGSWGHDNRKGRVYVFLGSHNMDNKADYIMNAPDEYPSRFGFSVSTAGDINADHYPDVIIGGPDWGPNQSGTACFYYGFGIPENTLGGLTLSTSPFSVTNAGYTVDVTATVNNIDNQPMNGVRVNFFRRGSQNTYTSSITDVSGNASVQAGSSSPAVDILVSVSGRYSDTSYIVWMSNDQCMTGDFNVMYNTTHLYVYEQQANVRFEIQNDRTARARIISDSNNDSVYVEMGSISGRFALSALSGNEILCTKVVYIDRPLPVQLASFTSSVEGRSVLLKWSTAAEENNSGFELLRSVGDNDFRSIMYIPGKVSSSQITDYSYEDKNLETGKYHYRLKQIDFNGNFEYFDLPEAVTIGVPDKYFVDQNYPNPFNPLTTIAYGIPQSGNVVLKIFDMAGREVMTLVNEFKDAGYYVAKFDGSSLASGTYIYRIESGSFVSARKMVLLK
ncbi:MAG: FG-GAP-like repeat-containing protein [Ignavibacteria bacterium]|nr:FG-GAP-like repeat-containing protein [Ignavibacteria bacterium]